MYIQVPAVSGKVRTRVIVLTASTHMCEIAVFPAERLYATYRFRFSLEAARRILLMYP